MPFNKCVLCDTPLDESLDPCPTCKQDGLTITYSEYAVANRPPGPRHLIEAANATGTMCGRSRNGVVVSLADLEPPIAGLSEETKLFRRAVPLDPETCSDCVTAYYEHPDAK